jgi:hypothetical protein
VRHSGTVSQESAGAGGPSTGVTLVIGTDVDCVDRYSTELRCVVLDPVHGTVTHLVAEPKGRLGLARLVPMDLVEAAGGEIALRCGEAEFKNLAPAEETLAEFVPGNDAPVQLLRSGWRGAGGPTVEGGTISRIPETETVGLIPPGGWKRAAVTAFRPPTETSGGSTRSVSILALIRSLTCWSKRGTGQVAGQSRFPSRT